MKFDSEADEDDADEEPAVDAVSAVSAIIRKPLQGAQRSEKGVVQSSLLDAKNSTSQIEGLREITPNASESASLNLSVYGQSSWKIEQAALTFTPAVQRVLYGPEYASIQPR